MVTSLIFGLMGVFCGMSHYAYVVIFEYFIDYPVAVWYAWNEMGCVGW
ncbi:hypothetical protein FWH09_00030 [Candidatus Saccharibacteria bacterium]|nr:hypothetical protein [Candidatus Saccharibacteria bacterium]